jgi:hypothetical protein
MQPDAVVMNGDVCDFAGASRWPALGWEYTPEIADEIECVNERLAEIEAAAPKAKRYWPLGNHDARFESLIANKAPELAKVKGIHLKDHFPECWRPCWSLWVNDSLVIKHRFKSGIHAAFNNTMWAGKSIITGHLHKGIVYPFTDYNGTRYGVDLPWLAENYGPQVAYAEDSSVNWRSGYCLVTIKDGVMCQPELAFVYDVGVIEFRGERIKV